MSAIAGILYFNGAPVQPGLIEKLSSAMANRGPDEQNHWVKGSVALGHCMLRTAPESFSERQPLLSSVGKHVLVWDGRLDNRDELRRALVAKGVRLRDNTDPELVINAYLEWGESSASRLLGDFAYAIWDGVCQKIFCARDHMGARPFSYHINDEYFAFSSDEEALLQLHEVSGAPNEDRLAYIFSEGSLNFDYSHSWIEDAWYLMPAEVMSVYSNARLVKREYWNLEASDEIKFADDNEYEEAFVDIFTNAVKSRLRAVNPVSIMVSGGLDTAGIVASFKHLYTKNDVPDIHTHSTISDDSTNCIETQCILSLSAKFGNHAHYLKVPSVSGSLTYEELEGVAFNKPHPVDNSILLPGMMFLAASKIGSRVVINGASGDLSLDTPNDYISYIFAKGDWLAAWKESKCAVRNHTQIQGQNALRLALLSAARAYLPGWVKQITRGVNIARKRPYQRDLFDDFIKRKRSGMHVDTLKDTKFSSYSFEGLQYRYLNVLKPPGIVRGLDGFGRLASRFGVESRDPWADIRVIEFLSRLPLERKVHNGWAKYIVRSSFASDLDDRIIKRHDKSHLGWKLTQAIVNHKRDEFIDMLSSADCLVGKYMDSNKLNKYINRCWGDDSFHHWERLYDLAVVDLWLKRLV